MAVIRAEDAEEFVRPVAFGGERRELTAAEPLALPNVDRLGSVIPEPEPTPPPELQAPAEPPPPPVFEVPPEVIQSVYDQAVLQGIEEGKAQVYSELQILQQRYAGALDQLVAVSQQLALQNQVQLITLSCRVAEKLVRHELSVHPEALLALITEAIGDLGETDEVVVHCSVPDHEFIQENRSALQTEGAPAFGLRVVGDPTLEYGDFRLETQTGSVDGRVATQIEAVEGQLQAEQQAIVDEEGGG